MRFLAEAGRSRVPRSVDITEDWSAIRIPGAMDYADNYVTGVCALAAPSEEWRQQQQG